MYDDFVKEITNLRCENSSLEYKSEKLLKENQELKEKLDKYENPKDMTLFAMWCTEKVKDENKELKEKVRAVNKGLRKVQERSIKYKNRCFELNKKIYELEEQLEEYKEQVNKGLYNNCLPYKTGYNKAIKDKETQQKEFIKHLEDELDRLARECSQIYEDSLGKTRLVNEDIFNEVNKILSKYKKIIGVSDENNIK